MAKDTDVNPALTEAKLRALTRAWAVANGIAAEAFEASLIDPSVGAALATVSSGGGDGHIVPEDHDGPARVAFYLAEDEPRAVGRALRWAQANDAAQVNILAATNGSDLARRAGLLGSGRPSIVVWNVEGAAISPAVAVEALAPPQLAAASWALAGVISEAGARPVDDHGTLVAEVAGLEVARVVEYESNYTIDVGVGQADRELNQMVHREADPGTSLRRVIAAVAEFRNSTSRHPLTRIARERWLRSMVLDNPGLVGAQTMEPLVPLRPRGGLKISEPSAAIGTGIGDGRPIVVVAMAGVDLDVVPEAVDYRRRSSPEAELVLVMVERDLLLSAGPLDRVEDARVVALDPPWAS